MTGFHPRHSIRSRGLHRVGRSLPVMAGAVLAFVGLLFTGISAAILHTEQRYLARGAETEGTVVAARPVAKPSPGARITARYDDAQLGYPVEFEWTASPSPPPPIPGDRVRVFHIPGEMDSARVKPPDRLGPLVGLALGAPFVIAGALLVARGWREAMALHRLTRTGVRVTARVAGIRYTSLQVNGVTFKAIDFTYRDAEGRRREASSGPLAPDETDGWTEGDEGLAAYDPKRPDRAVWIGRGV